MGKQWKQWETLFFWAPKSLQMVTAALKLKDAPWKKSYDQLSMLKSRDITLPTKICLVKVTVFWVVMYGCECWTIKKDEHQRIDAFELWCWKSPLDCKEIKPVNPKGNQSWKIRIDAEAKTPILWPPDAKSWLLGKDPDAGKDWRREEKGTTQDEMVGWHHRLEGHEFLQAPGVGDRQGTLACCSPWDHKKSDMTERLNWLTEGK